MCKSEDFAFVAPKIGQILNKKWPVQKFVPDILRVIFPTIRREKIIKCSYTPYLDLRPTPYVFLYISLCV